MGNKIENLLSRVVAVEDRFNSRPSDVAEQRRRDEVMRYAIFSFMFSTYLLPASSRSSRNSCGRRPMLIMSKMMKKRSHFSKIYGRRSSIIRFVSHPNTLLSINRATGGTTNDGQRRKTQLDGECPHLFLEK